LEVTRGHVALSRTSIERPLERDLSLMKTRSGARGEGRLQPRQAKVTSTDWLSYPILDIGSLRSSKRSCTANTDGAISEVATRRSEFAAILKTEGIDGLISALKRINLGVKAACVLRVLE